MMLIVSTVFSNFLSNKFVELTTSIILELFQLHIDLEKISKDVEIILIENYLVQHSYSRFYPLTRTGFYQQSFAQKKCRAHQVCAMKTYSLINLIIFFPISSRHKDKHRWFIRFTGQIWRTTGKILITNQHLHP